MPVYQLPTEPLFPDPEEAEEGGLVAIGGDLTTDRLLNAYSTGIFPWYSEGQPILWFSPDPRMVLLPGEFKRSKSLTRIIASNKFELRIIIASNKFELRIDTQFAEVIKACSKIPRPGQDGTWITEDMIAAYIGLHRIGVAHSFETYCDNELVGGLYGVSLGKAFFGESMFHLQRDASKFAFAALVDFCENHDFHFIDAQVPTEHLATLGAEEMTRPNFLGRLAQAMDNEGVVGSWTTANENSG